MKIPLFFFFFLFTLLSASQALKFNIGGSDGWTLNPSENYNQWAGRNRFQINDILVFKYKKGSDSVLEVNKEDYEKCNKTNPIKKSEDGDTEFTLNRAGPFYFISGNDQNCEKGQKLTLVVISPRTKIQPPFASPPSGSPPATATPSPSVSLSPPASSPASLTPAVSPVTAGGPTASSPIISTPPAGGPTASSPSISTPPAGGPMASSPSISTPPAGGPAALAGPGAAPSGSPLGSEGLAPGGTSNSPGSSNSAGPAAAPASKSGLSVAPSSFLMYFVTIVVGAVFLRY